MNDLNPIKNVLTKHSETTLYKRLRQVRLHPSNPMDPVEIYKDAHFLLRTIPCQTLRALGSFQTDAADGLPAARGIWPAQTYVTKSGLERSQAVTESLLQHKIDPAWLKSFCTVELESGMILDVLPPVVEYSMEKALGPIWLINDGLHRIYRAATDPNMHHIRVVLVWGLPFSKWPYYAFPTTWESIRVVDEKPPAEYTKRHRYPDRYRHYYRDFSSAFAIGRQGGA